MDQARYYVFTRTWWSMENGRRVPGAGKRSMRGHPRNLSFAEAQAYCREWNATHKPGPLSRKAEFDQQ